MSKKKKNKNKYKYSKKNENTYTHHTSRIATPKDVNDVAIAVFGSLYKSSF